MRYFEIGGGAARLSRVVLGGHEYLPNGKSRGFNEDFELAVTPGSISPGFGGPSRLAVLAKAYDLGINVFDVTIDAEKEALGRNLADMPPPYETFVQTRPEGMVYGYNRFNRKMADRVLLRQEVLRCLKLLRRERLDILNLGILRGALEHDGDFLAKLSDGIAALKSEGLVRFVAADTFSGEGTLLAMIETASFDLVNLNFNLADDLAEEVVVPAARRAGMAVVAREIFAKGAFFGFGHEAAGFRGVDVARAAMRWSASRPGIDAVIVGANDPSQLEANTSSATSGAPDAADLMVIRAIGSTPGFVALREMKRADFRPVGAP